MLQKTSGVDREVKFADVILKAFDVDSSDKTRFSYLTKWFKQKAEG